MKRTFPSDTLGQADSVLKAYREIDPSLKLGTQDQEGVRRKHYTYSINE